MDSELSEEMEVKVGMHQRCALSYFLFVDLIGVMTELATEGMLYELLHFDNIALMSETIEGLRNMIRKLKNVHSKFFKC